MEEKYRVRIEGTRPLLMHRMPVTDEGDSKKQTPEQRAERCLYKTKSGDYYIPFEAVLGCCIKAATNYRVPGRNKKTYKDMVSAGLQISQLELPLEHDGYEIDSRAVCIQRARIIRNRPMFREWASEFDVEITEENLLNLGSDKKPIVSEILQEAGKHVGLLDFRPRFGLFKVTKFEKVENGNGDGKKMLRKRL